MSVAEDRHICVLVVDDHPMVREGLRSMLSTAANLHVVGEAGTAHEAVLQAKALQPDVVLLDLQLPDMDGLTALQQIKAVAPTARVLIVTMHDHAAYIGQAATAGAAGYVLKGARRQELLVAIQTVVLGGTVTVPFLLGQVQEHAVKAPTPSSPSTRRAALLSPIETELLGLLAEGLSNKAISGRMHWSLSTVKKYVQRLFDTLGVCDRTQAVAVAIRRGLIE
jgi:DNA-binding NarL/FixJ family response regulator